MTPVEEAYQKGFTDKLERYGIDKQAGLGFLAALKGLSTGSSKLLRHKKSPLSNYYANIARSGFEHGSKGGTGSPRVMGVLANLPFASALGVNDYMVANSIGKKLRSTKAKHQAGDSVVSQGIDALQGALKNDPDQLGEQLMAAKEQLQSPLARNLAKGLENQATGAKTDNWFTRALDKRFKVDNKDTFKNTAATTAAIDAAIGLATGGPSGALMHLAAESPHYYGSKLVESGKVNKLLDVKKKLINRYDKGGKVTKGLMNLYDPAIAELSAFNKDLNNLQSTAAKL
jgi:hypothetical protein